MSHVGFQTHEFEADYIYTEHGRQGYFAIGRLVDACDGAGYWTFQLGGDTWKVKLYHQEGGIKPRPDDAIPQDQAMHEYRLKCRPVT